MILATSYEKYWINEITKGFRKAADPKLVEKIIYALSLLEQLKLSGLELIFKGGTSLILMSEIPVRFSIDVDIIVNEPPENMSVYLDKIIKTGLFLTWKDDNDRKSSKNAPVKHYKFYYKSTFDSLFAEEPILLDILFADKIVYPTTNNLPIKHKWLLTEEPYKMIKVPSYESLLGDKLTAFAPNTTGILYTKNRPVEIIKQLFDIAYLFDHASNFDEVRTSYLNVVKEEIQYRQLSISIEDVLEDTFSTALIITRRDHSDEKFVFLQKGISNIGNFIISPFRIEEAIICAAKTAYLTRIIKKMVVKDISRFRTADEIAELNIAHKEFAKLNRLKSTLPEAFFYWYYAVELGV